MALTTLFENRWKAARGFKEKQKPDDNGLSDLESAILREFALGLTDESASRKLGISVRTLRRIVASLMSRMDANSRFQAGVQASKSGWL